MDQWTRKGAGDGLITYSLDSWSHFFDFLEAELFSNPTYFKRPYVWRGQRRADWSLSTTLDRIFGRLDLLSLKPDDLEKMSSKHLSAFKYATRGRRGVNHAVLSENEWWALGQHFGLATPLLDWTRSPFAAAYFAFEELAPDATDYRVVYALDEKAVLAKTIELENGESFETGRLAIVELVDPFSDENQRLVSQGGCFTRAPIGTPIEKWVARYSKGRTRQFCGGSKSRTLTDQSVYER